MSGWTPGPWRMVRGRIGTIGQREEDKQAVFIVEAPSLIGKQDIGQRVALADSNEANARLIAAAPALAEALEVLLDASTKHAGERCCSSCVAAELGALAALEAARGRG